jgi:hypothetical protein
MKRLLLATIFAVVASTALAQVPGYPTACSMCRVFSYVDLAPDGATVSASNMQLEGWGFECVGGQAINRVDVYYQDYDGYYHPLKQADYTFNGGRYRPDVAAHYAPYCPKVSTNTGWLLTLNNPPPTGLRRVAINVWSGGLYEGHTRTYLVTP